MNHREVLGVSANASRSEIKKAFRSAAMEIHPDHSDSPEAIEAFKKIREAHDALMNEADEAPRESVTATTSAAHAAAATTQAAYSGLYSDPDMSPEELAHIQELDEMVRQSPKRKSFFRRAKESAELRRHRKKLKTNEDRISGRY